MKKTSLNRSLAKRHIPGPVAAVLLVMAFFTHADPLPTGGHITAGTGSISQSGNRMTVVQTSERMISEWQSFNIDAGARVDFTQPSRTSVVLNRINNGDPSHILGTLTANGRVYLLNPSGIIFGKTAQVDVGALVASTLDLSDKDFLAGRDVFSNGGNAGGVLNQGALSGQVVALIAPRVQNAGTITARNGSVTLAAGDRVSLDFTGDNLLNVAVDRAAFAALVENKGLIQADGGRVVMSAQSAGDLMATVLNSEGIIQARSLVERNGRILLDGGDRGITQVGGSLDASGAESNGGSILVTGDKVLVGDGARLDAGGKTGGGEILVGGAWQGGDASVRQAHATVVQRGAVLDASATDTGNGGTVVAWSDVDDPGTVTRAYGTFLARGGVNGGDGGRIETSGHGVDVNGIQVSTGAPRGASGLWLIDPSDITITNAGTGTLTGGVFDPAGVDTISPATILAGLGSSDVTLQTSGGSGGSGNISVADSIVVAADFGAVRTLTLTADGGISFSSGKGIDGTNSSTNALHITLTGATMDLTDAILKTALGTVTLNATSASAVTESASTVINADKLLLSGAGATYTLNAGSHAVTTLAANTDSVDYLDSDALIIGAVGATNGITATGTVSAATASGDLTLAQSISTTDTTAAAVVLNAGKNAVAGTSSGGNIIISGSPTIGTGAGGRATLFSGSVAGSTGLTGLVGPGSGRFRYNSDEAASNFSAALGAGQYGIFREQPTVTITANNQALTYGTAPTGSSTVTGLQNGDTTVQAISTPATVTAGGATSTSGNYTVGSHTLTPSGAVGGLGYGFSYATGTLTVNAKALSAAFTGVDKVYDGTTSATVTTSDNREAGDLFTINHSELFATNKNVGSGKTISVTGVGLSGADAGNYTVAATGSATANITQRTLNVSYTGSNKVYDGTTVAAATTGDDRVAGDSLTINRTSAFSDKNVGSGKTVNISAVSLSGTDGGNYSVASTGSTTADITARILNVTYTGVNRAYDGTAIATVTTSDNRVAGDVITINRSATFTAGPNVGTGKVISVTGVNLTDTDAGNYSVSATGSTSADITPKALTLAATASNKIYDGTAAATVTGYGLAGFVGAETVVASSSSATFNSKTAATGKTVTIGGITLSDGANGGLASNYSVAASTAATADIIPRVLTVAYTGVNKIYDGNALAAVTTADDRVAGDVFIIDRSAAFSDKNVGAGKAVTVSGAGLSGTDAANYTLAAGGSTTADIAAKALTASYTAAGKVYDGSTSVAVVGGSADIVNGDLVTFSETAGFSDKDVGVGKVVNVGAITLGGADAGNYNLQNPTATTGADITPKPLTLTVTAADKVYDGNTTAQVATYNLSGFVGSETVTAASATALFNNRYVGADKTVTISGITLVDGTNGGLAGNYSVQNGITAIADIRPNPYAFNVTSSLTSRQAGINGTSAAISDATPGVIMEASNTVGPGAGTESIADSGRGLFEFGKTIPAATSALTLTINGDSSPVRFSTAGRTVTLHLGTAEAGIAWPVSAVLTVFTIDGGARPQAIGAYNIVDNGSSVSLTSGFAAKSMPKMRAKPATSATVALSMNGEESLRLLASLMTDGTLVITLPRDSDLDVDHKTLVLLGLAAAKQQGHTAVNKIKAVVIRK